MRCLQVLLLIGTLAGSSSVTAASGKGAGKPLTLEAVNQAEWKQAPGRGDRIDPVVLRAQVLLDRAHFSPGPIDGRLGSNLKKALQAYQKEKGLKVSGQLDAETWKALAASGGPVLTRYTLTAQDVTGPFVKRIPKEEKEMAKLERLAYTSPLERLSERFHAAPRLLKRLNPGVDFKQADVAAVVPQVGGAKLEAKVAEVEVDRSAQAVRAYDAEHHLLAAYPATVGSAEYPSPSGDLKVTAVAKHPDLSLSRKLIYARTKLKPGEKLRVPPGPNNPVGSVWIGLNKPGYGIHGSPEPSQVGKTASHGCVRLTNWDAEELARGIKTGVRVRFVGE